MSSSNLNIFPKYNNCRYFVETGSYKGDGIQNALDAGFEFVISIEITKMYYDICKERFKNEPRVILYNGDTTVLLPEVIKDIEEKITFWIDAHYSDPSTEWNGKKMSPLLDELDLIADHAKKYGDNILVDDRRCWSQSDPFYPNYLFTALDVENKIKSIREDYEIGYDEGFVKDDVIVAIVKEKIVEEILQEVIPLSVEIPQKVKPLNVKNPVNNSKKKVKK